MTEKMSANFKKIIIIFFALAMILIPINNIFVDGIYNWHIQQPRFYLSGLQCIVFLGITYVCALIKKEHAGEIILLFSALFMIMQGVIIPYVTVYVYFEIICFIGSVVASRIFEKTDLIINFITGVSVWGAISILFSVCGQGTINDLRIITVCLLVICLLINKEKYEFMPQKLINFINKNIDKKINVLLICTLVFLNLILAAKSNVGQDFDSLWYMLKPEYTLVGENSFYDYLGYSAFVYYYPKLVEFFYLPVSGLGDYSFLLIANVFIYSLFVVLLYKLLSFMCQDCEEWIKLLLLVVLVTLPSLTSVVPSVKGDNFGALLTMSGITFFLVFVKKKDIRFLIFSFLSLFLSTGTKVTFFLWAGIVGIIALVYAIIYLCKAKDIQRKGIINNATLFVILSNLLFVFGIHFRTYKLTGYPTFPVMLNVWNKIGFTANYAIKDVEVSWNKISLTEMPSRIYHFFFCPNELEHTVMCWPTNVIFIFAFALLVVLFRKKIQLDTTAAICLIISFFEMIFAFYHLLTMQQPDGNYFHVPFLVFCITCIYIIYINKGSARELLTRKFIASFLVIILVLNIPLMFVSNWCWEIGIEPFSTQLVGDNYSDYKKDDELFKQEGYYEIAKYIEKEFGNKRILASGTISRVKGAVETTWSAFSEQWCSTDILGTYENFKNYVAYANIKGFLVMNSDESFFKDYVIQLVTECGADMVIQDEGAVFYIVSIP